MKTRYFPYGTTYAVEVVCVETVEPEMIIGCKELQEPGAARKPEGFLLVERAGAYDCRPGDLGKVTFTRYAGRVGGYWKLEILRLKGGAR